MVTVTVCTTVEIFTTVIVVVLTEVVTVVVRLVRVWGGNVIVV
jgi:hypothetical protein